MKYREFTCVVCGRKAIDKGVRQDAKYCSQTCNQKGYYLARRAKPYVGSVCRYNDGVTCNSCNCAECGWNPAVEKMRKEALI